jgi:ketosteroid isomerase-like protein
MASRQQNVDRAVAAHVAVDRFNDAFSEQDLDALSELITDDCVIDTTDPAPDGTRFTGRDAVLAAWQAFFQSSPEAMFETEEIFACGDRCVVRWRYTWDPGDVQRGHVRGVDVFRVRGDRIAEKLSYVNG